MYRYVASALLFIFLSCAPKKNIQPDQLINVIPAPASVKAGNDILQWRASVTIVAASTDEKAVAELLKENLVRKDLNITISEQPPDGDFIRLEINDAANLHPEGYRLTINKTGVIIKAPTAAGLFYGAQSLIQLAADPKQIPFVEIEDQPRFAYRGLHLDVGRHMFPVDFIKKNIDLMARFKFNRFHWHLTEDQGWRIEIKKYPKLQQVAAYRKETVVGHAGKSKNYDGTPYGGYYTQQEIKEIVEYARQRFITIIPEIELPGHSQAALAAYPELGCTGGPYEVATTWGVFDNVYCAGKEKTFQFLQDVLDEVIELFPSEYIHIGGDECPKTSWKNCRDCQARLKKENLKDEHELQSYFIQRIEKYLNSKGRQIIGWDEILEGGLAPNATVMSWRGEAGGIEAAKQKHHVIMTPGNWCYFDHYQDTAATEPLAIGGFTPVQEVYSYEPIPPQLTAQEAPFILGAQANLWTEYIKTPAHAEYMAYPRACALAEVVWSDGKNRDYANFVKRLKANRWLLDEMRVNYAKHIFK
ncbi:MAG: beta-N-acetylhexosaminidase [Flammeovirgaceae bacterium]|nr:MAG: beta-N-acetylhexosaminidase [Flammeovirgaceae bacterium]